MQSQTLVQGFAPIQIAINHHPKLQLHALSAKKKKSSRGKGFGTSKTTTSSPPPSIDDEQDDSTAATTATTTTSQATTDQPTLTGGQEALARLRRQEAERRNDELRAIREMKAVDNMVKEDPNAAVIPERVAQRMGQRMLPFVGIPLFGVMGAFVLFWYLATYKNMEFQPTLVAYSTIGIMAVGLLGITYSVMSASWDEEVEGSAVGIDEFKKNFGSVQEGLSRSRENLILREKASTLSEEEYERAVRTMDKKEEKAERRSASLDDKLRKELE